MMSKIKRVMHGLEKDLDIVVMLIRYQRDDNVQTLLPVPGAPTIQTNIARASRSENDTNERALGIAKSKPCAVFANGES